MYRNLARIVAAAAAVSAAGLAPAAAQSTPAKSDASAAKADNQWLSFDAATNTVTFKLEAGTNTAAVAVKSPFNFNGYTNGEATLVVPPKSKIVLPFVNEDGTPHSAEIIADKEPMPNAGGEPAIPRAYTNKVVEGMAQGETDVIRFTAPDTGSYRIICGVPGHALSGMWLWFKVDPAAKAPTFGSGRR
jgi:sulfocyanin